MTPSSDGTKLSIADYYMSIHFGVCIGPVDALTGIYINDKPAWEGNLTFGSFVSIQNDDFYGGLKKEGGISGAAVFLPGNSSQLMPSYLASKFQRTPTTMSGYRGLTSVFFTAPNGGFYSPQGFFGGFKWGSNTPYLRPVSIRVFRQARGLNEAYGLIATQVIRDRTVTTTQPDGTQTDTVVQDLFIVQDANPAHIIYECLTNTTWGMGAPSTIVDVPMFEAVAQALYFEGFGLSMMWTQQAQIEGFITEVLDHIQATMFVNPRTGLLNLKLIRGGYDVNSLRVFDPDNCVLTDWQRKLWGETSNELIVTWTNPANEQEETITQHDLANISMQGQIVSDSRNYYGVRNANLAATLCARDLRTASAPLATCNIEADRRAWDLTPGDVIKITWPEYGIDQMVFRINNVDYGKPGDGRVKASLIEDVFGLEYAAFHVPPSSAWSDPSELPTPIVIAQAITLPYYANARFSTGTPTYPSVRSGVFATHPSSDVVNYDLYENQPVSTGGTAYQLVGTKHLAFHSALISPLSRTNQSDVVSFASFMPAGQPEIGALAIIGSGAENVAELALIESFSSGTGWRLQRGVLDTVPRAWPAGTPIWFLSSGYDGVDANLYGAGDTVQYKLLTRTSLGLLALADAPVLSKVLIDRPHRPLRPANVKVENNLWGPVALPGEPSTVAVTWANRNRLLEDAQIRRWTEADVPGETGQTTVVQVRDQSGNVVTEHAGLTGTSFAVPLASFSDLASAVIRVASRRDGLESLQAQEIVITLSDRSGYGFDYGNNYGAP